ncbi:transposase [Sorangium sp. So ce1099]|uniref:transposase n=1 Tax=Sorangium sp. So ce1099 TaxID=3133331 RepID=UPI003F5D6224
MGVDVSVSVAAQARPGRGVVRRAARIFVESVERFYEERAARRGACGAVKSGAVTVVQRTSGDMRLNPHLHVVFLDGAYHEDGTELVWNELGHLRTGEVGQVLERQTG